MKWNRRQFLATTLAGLSPLPGMLLRAADSSQESEEVLVVLQLSGGNDGLNTVIPYEESSYFKNRPSLAVSKGSVHRLDAKTAGRSPGGPEVGLHSSLGSLVPLYKEGVLSVVQGVGYPNSSRSHFRAMDAWHTALPDDPEAKSGWLGRIVADAPRGPGHRGAMHLGDEELPLALSGEVEVPSLQNLDWLDFLSTDAGASTRKRLLDLNRMPRSSTSVSLERVRSLAVSTLENVEKLIALRSRPIPVEYPGSSLARKLQWAGQLIAGGFPARIYYLTFGGFDTHAQQADAHASLLERMGEAVAAFYRHLEATESHQRTTLLAFSEFGRRVKENGSRGTDHGSAGPAFVVSSKFRGGLIGEHPKLDELERGDLKFHTDFRRLYATLLDDVIGVDSAKILGGTFEKLPL